ncbi:MAG TPA: kelch repeat-containing protein [Bacteroidales bacterium]|nr:kelch repeat-containing protein [Bacteroidales bacterium]
MKLDKILYCLLFSVALTLTGCEDDDETVYGDWVKRSDFEGVARSDAASFSTDGKGYVFGGYDGKNRLNDLWEYNIDQDFWTQKATFPGSARTNASSFSLNNKGYICNGYNGDIYFNDFWEYDPSLNEWHKKADFGGSARLGAVGFSVSGYGYVGAGYDGNYLKDMWKYDPSADTWTQIVSLGGSKRNNAAAFVYGDKAYIVGGINNGAYVTDFWRFDPSSTSWTELRQIADKSDEDYDDDYNIARSNPNILLIGNRIFLTCGESGSIRSDTWEYLPDTDLWDLTSDFEGTARTSAVTIHNSNRAFVLTGRSSTYRFDDMWEFLPDIEYDEN